MIRANQNTLNQQYERINKWTVLKIENYKTVFLLTVLINLILHIGKYQNQHKS